MSETEISAPKNIEELKDIVRAEISELAQKAGIIISKNPQLDPIEASDAVFDEILDFASNPDNRDNSRAQIDRLITEPSKK